MAEATLLDQELLIERETAFGYRSQGTWPGCQMIWDEGQLMDSQDVKTTGVRLWLSPSESIGNEKRRTPLQCACSGAA
ncbi:hypothetical protein CSOJ01_09301 [Colletotrichum sojae]|uniref:Uncharacterized protein n=1 Tax=Colletotrichum sojae TaxID=2175907 RepID=A0A8H6J3W7_9PEZI|nr:hypothetical protein CSOJ01_09301 [Colletotrichum sojae]